MPQRQNELEKALISTLKNSLLDDAPTATNGRKITNDLFADFSLWVGGGFVAGILLQGGELTWTAAGFGLAGLLGLFLTKTGLAERVATSEKTQDVFSGVMERFRKTAVASSAGGNFYKHTDDVALGIVYGSTPPRYTFRRLRYMENTGFFAATRRGKSVFLNTLLYQILKRMSPEDVRIAIVDGKGVDYTHFLGVRHLLCPIAQEPHHYGLVLDKVIGEITQRRDWFRQVTAVTKRPCANMGDYHKLVPSSGALLAAGLPPHLPEIILVLDEAHKVLTSKTLEDKANLIASTGMAFGVKIWLTTQYNKADVLSTVIQRNLPSKFIGFMGRTRGAYTVGGTEIPPEIDLNPLFQDVPGRFLVMEGIDVEIVQVDPATEKQMMDVIMAVSGEPWFWPEKDEEDDATAVVELRGSNEMKKAIILREFPDDPGVDDFMELFGVGQATYYRWKNKGIWE